METVNEKLRALYDANYSNIQKIFDSGKNIDGPLLMHCWDEDYNSQNKKILFVGQEGTGGVFRDYLGGEKVDVLYQRKDHTEIPEDFLDACVGFYKMILNIPKHKGRFWKKVKDINYELNGNRSTHSFLTTNVSKYCNCADAGSPPLVWNDHVFIAQELNILVKEIEIANPDIVIFLSGKRYDDKLQIQFKEKIAFEPVCKEISTNDLAKLRHPSLPENTFRTWHPNARDKEDFTPIIILAANGCDLNGLLDKFKSQLSSIANSLNLDENDKDLLIFSESSISFEKNEWGNLSIVLGFDSFFDEFYFGIGNADITIPLSESIHLELTETFGKPEGTTTICPWCKYFVNYKKWDKKTIDALVSGKLHDEILTTMGKMKTILDKNI